MYGRLAKKNALITNLYEHSLRGDYTIKLLHETET